MTKILGISGKKQSGKTSCGNFLMGCAMLSNDLVEYAEINKGGELLVPFESEGGENKPCVFPATTYHPAMVSYMSENIWKDVKIYNFADPLKATCMNILGLTYAQCYGTDEEKNSPTKIDLPNTLAEKKVNRKMSAREVMQYVGTDFFRRIYPNVWVDSTVRRIRADNPKLAVIVDCRFPNEVEGVQVAGGKVIRLTRDIFNGSDTHASEIALDSYDGFDCTIDNQDMSVEEQNIKIYNQLSEWCFVDFKSVAKHTK